MDLGDLSPWMARRLRQQRRSARWCWRQWVAQCCCSPVDQNIEQLPLASSNHVTRGSPLTPCHEVPPSCGTKSLYIWTLGLNPDPRLFQAKKELLLRRRCVRHLLYLCVDAIEGVFESLYSVQGAVAGIPESVDVLDHVLSEGILLQSIEARHKASAFMLIHKGRVRGLIKIDRLR